MSINIPAETPDESTNPISVEEFERLHPAMLGAIRKAVREEPARTVIGTVGDDRRSHLSNLDLLEASNVIGMNVSYGLVFHADDDSNVTCAEAAVVNYGHDSCFGVKLGGPLVRSLIGSNLDAPTGDKVRVLTYLVRVGRQAVGFGGKHVGFLADAEGLLRDLVGVMRLDEGGAPGDAADGGERKTDDVEPIHRTDSSHEGGA